MKKKLPLIIFIIFCVVLSLSYGIGSYFVNYALAPHITNEEVQEKIRKNRRSEGTPPSPVFHQAVRRGAREQAALDLR